MKNSVLLIDRVEKFIENRYFFCFFFLLSALIFSPFFLFGHIIIGNTDTVLNHYPNIIFGYRALKQGSFGLWNPYIFLGQDFASSMHHHMLNPANLILLLFPEKWFLHGLTLIEFLEIGFVGLFAFKIANCYMVDKVSALFPTIITQLSSFTWFVTSTFIGVELFLMSLILIYLIVNYQRRREVVSLILMAISIFAIFVVGHLAYIVAFLMPVFAVLIYTSLHTKVAGVGKVFSVAFILGLGLASYRLVPIIIELSRHGSPFDWIESPAGVNSYFILSGFLPGILGLEVGDSSAFFSSLGLFGRHVQIHNFLYYGLLPIFLMVLSLYSDFGKKCFYLSVAAIVAMVTQVFLVQPIADLVNMILHPFMHTIVPRVGVSFLIFALSGAIANVISRNRFHISEGGLRFLLILICITFCLAITFWLNVGYSYRKYLFGNNLFFILFYFVKFALLLFIGLFFYVTLRMKLSISFAQRLVNISLVIFLISVVAWVLATYVLRSISQMELITFLFSIGSVFWVMLSKNYLRGQIAYNKLLIFLTFLCFLVLDPARSSGRHAGDIAILVPVILANFLVVAFFSWELLISLYEKKITPRQFLFTSSLFLMGTLLFALKIYGPSGCAQPFAKRDLYPKLKEKSEVFDFKQYRVTHPRNYLHGVPYAGADPTSNIFMVYKLRSYAGVDSIISHQLSSYIDNFIQDASSFKARMGISPIIKNDRLLDLMGVKYDFYSDKPLIRMNAVPRLSMYFNYKVVPDINDQLLFLGSDRFPLQKTTLLLGSPSSEIKIQQRNNMKVDFLELDSGQKIVANIKNSEEGIIVFNDRYSKDWRAYWNGIEIPVMGANVLFMAVKKPIGSGVLEFSYHPVIFYWFLNVSLCFVVVLSLLALYAFIGNDSSPPACK